MKRNKSCLTKKLAALCFTGAILLFVLSGCGNDVISDNADKSSASVSETTANHVSDAEIPANNEAYTFTDDLDREVTVENPQRIGIASGSFAECWQLAGGTLTAVTQDAIEERQLELSEDIINLGSVMNPSVEMILDADLDFLVLSSSMKHHLAMAETLDKAGITYAYMDVETFEDYLHMLKIFTDITGRSDLYKKNGTAIANQIAAIIADNLQADSPKVLILRSSSSKVTARNSDTMVGQMLKNLGCINIADQEDSLLETLSLEVIAQEDPDYIFVICHGDTDEAQANLEDTISANPIWQTLSAVKNERLFYLEKELFHYKPNVRWSESYEVLAKIFAEN